MIRVGDEAIDIVDLDVHLVHEARLCLDPRDEAGVVVRRVLPQIALHPLRDVQRYGRHLTDLLFDVSRAACRDERRGDRPDECFQEPEQGISLVGQVGSPRQAQ